MTHVRWFVVGVLGEWVSWHRRWNRYWLDRLGPR